MRSPHGILCISDSPSGLHGDYWELVGNAGWSPHGAHGDSLWTPQSLCGLHGNPWVSVKYLTSPYSESDFY